jgi:hypothetical protein
VASFWSAPLILDTCHRLESNSMPPEPRSFQCFVLQISHTAVSIQPPYVTLTSAPTRVLLSPKCILTPQKLYPEIGTSCRSPTRRPPPHGTPLASFKQFSFRNSTATASLHPFCILSAPSLQSICGSEIFKSLPRSYPLPPKSLSLLRLSQQSRVSSSSNFYK